MSAASALARGRRAAEGLMGDLFVVRRRTGEVVQNETTGREEPVLEDRFTTAGRLQMRGPSTTEAAAGGRTVTISTLEWHTPLAAEIADTDDLVELLEPGPGTDPALVGTVVRVVAPVTKSHATARRYRVELT